MQDALGGTLRTFLGADNGPSSLPLPHIALLGRNPRPAPPSQTLDQHRQPNRLYRGMRIGAAQREISRNKGERFLAPGYACVPRADWFGRYDDTVLPKGADVWYQGDDGLWWLGKISESTTEDKVYLVRFLDDPGPINPPLPPARYTTLTEAVRGSWCAQVDIAIGFPRGMQCNVGES